MKGNGLTRVSVSGRFLPLVCIHAFRDYFTPPSPHFVKTFSATTHRQNIEKCTGSLWSINSRQGSHVVRLQKLLYPSLRFTPFAGRTISVLKHLMTGYGHPVFVDPCYNVFGDHASTCVVASQVDVTVCFLLL